MPSLTLLVDYDHSYRFQPLNRANRVPSRNSIIMDYPNTPWTKGEHCFGRLLDLMGYWMGYWEGDGHGRSSPMQISRASQFRGVLARAHSYTGLTKKNRFERLPFAFST